MSDPAYFYYAPEIRGWMCPLCVICPGVESIPENIKALDKNGHKTAISTQPGGGLSSWGPGPGNGCVEKWGVLGLPGKYGLFPATHLPQTPLPK